MRLREYKANQAFEQELDQKLIDQGFLERIEMQQYVEQFQANNPLPTVSNFRCLVLPILPIQKKYIDGIKSTKNQGCIQATR